LHEYKNLRFIGLALTNAHSYDFVLKLMDSSHQNCKNNSKIIVTGESTEQQLIASLKFYKSRQIFIQKALSKLFLLTKNFQQEEEKNRIDLLLLIVELIQIHSKSQSVQLAATSCVFNFLNNRRSNNNLKQIIPNYIVTLTINSILQTMSNFPNVFNLQKNCLLMFRNEKLLKNYVICLFNLDFE
jgi:hypothetical protein